MNGPSQILVASPDIEQRRALASILANEGWETICASRVSECAEILSKQNVSLVFCERRLADGSYRDVVAATRSLENKVRVVVTSRLADWDEYLDALHHGAFDLIASPCRPTDVLWAIIQARREDHECTLLLGPSRAEAVRAATA